MKFLLIDDHEMTLEGYVSILKQPQYKFHKAPSCKEVYDWLQEGNIPDVSIVDFNLISFHEQNLYTGVDCVHLIKKYNNQCKIILITAHDEALILYKMYKSVMPDALIVKADFTRNMIYRIVSENSKIPFLSEKAKLALQKVKTKETLLSTTNVEILMYLTNGFKVSEIATFIGFSSGAIQKRVNKMLKEFQVGNYHELIRLAIKMKLF